MHTARSLPNVRLIHGEGKCTRIIRLWISRSPYYPNVTRITPIELPSTAAKLIQRGEWLKIDGGYVRGFQLY